MEWKEIFEEMDKHHIVKENPFSESGGIYQKVLDGLNGNYKEKDLAGFFKFVNSPDDEIDTHELENIRKRLIEKGVKKLPPLAINIPNGFKTAKFLYSFPVFIKSDFVIGDEDYIKDLSQNSGYGVIISGEIV